MCVAITSEMQIQVVEAREFKASRASVRGDTVWEVTQVVEAREF